MGCPQEEESLVSSLLLALFPSSWSSSWPIEHASTLILFPCPPSLSTIEPFLPLFVRFPNLVASSEASVPIRTEPWEGCLWRLTCFLY